MAINRYQRQEVLPDFGLKAQKKLTDARVLIVGCGGLGSPAATYLARAGVGHIILMDGDEVQLTNLHRQIIFDESDVGQNKARVALLQLQRANSEIFIEAKEVHLTSENATKYIGSCDVVLDGSDNFYTKYVCNDSAVALDKPIVYGTVNRYEGQVTVFNMPLENGKRSANMRHLFPNITDGDALGNCEINGIMGPVAGMIGQMMALECIKILTGVGQVLANRLLMVDAFDYRFQWLRYGLKVMSSADEDMALVKTWKEVLTEDITDCELVDVRSTDERAAWNPGGRHRPEAIEGGDESYNGVPVFYCATGIRARKALIAYLKVNASNQAFYIAEPIAVSKQWM